MQFECTKLFSDAEWAQAHIDRSNNVRMNVQQRNHIFCFHIRIDQITPFLDHVRNAQKEYAALMSTRSEQG